MRTQIWLLHFRSQKGFFFLEFFNSNSLKTVEKEAAKCILWPLGNKSASSIRGFLAVAAKPLNLNIGCLLHNLYQHLILRKRKMLPGGL